MTLDPARAARDRARDLAPAGPVELVDRSFWLAKRLGLRECGRAWLAGALFAGSLVLVFYVERVEGVVSLRLPLAALVVGAFALRSMWLSEVAARALEMVRPGLIEPGAGRAVDRARTSLIVGLGAWVWAWVYAAAALLGPLGVIFVLPLAALRGGVAPSWIARAAAARGAGLKAFAAATRDTRGRRAVGVASEGLLLLGALGLAANLYATCLIAALVARTFIGLEVATVSTFLSPENTFVQLAMLGGALVSLEPLRAAGSALAFLESRVRADGLDLEAGIDAAIAHAASAGGSGTTGGVEAAGEAPAAGERERGGGSGARRGSGRVAAATLALLGALHPGLAQAQGAQSPQLGDLPRDSAPLEASHPREPARTLNDPGAPPPIVLRPGDEEALRQANEILARGEFRELEGHRSRGARDLLRQLLEWLGRAADQAPAVGPTGLDQIPLPGPAVFVALALALLLAVAIALVVTRRRERSALRRVERPSAAPEALGDRSPGAFLDEAGALAEAGRFREALRALYLATLVSLDRRRAIVFDPHHTNWQYLRQMARGPAREAFKSFTARFDHAWYGHKATTREDFDACRELARAIVDGATA